MPTTKWVVTRVVSLTKWNRDGDRGVLPILDEIHRYMRSHDCETNLYIDPSTGFPPYLTTTAGTYQYSMEDTVRKIGRVFTAQTENGYDDVSQYRYLAYLGEQYYEVPVTTRPRTRGTNAYLVFRDDPGTSTSKYFYERYDEPATISSESVNLEVEEQFHDLVVDGCVARIREYEYGDNAPYMQWRDRVAVDYWGTQNENYYHTGLMQKRFC